MASKKAAQGTSLVLRTCSADMTSYGGFKWPNEVGAVVEAPDWKKNDECGNGLHGWLFGKGDHGCSSSIKEEGAKWLVVEVVLSDTIALGGKVKFPRCTIRHIGDQASATQFLEDNEPRAKNVAVIGACRQVGKKSVVQVGAFGTASAGDWGTASAGYKGTASAGIEGTASAGDKGTASAGYKGTASAGDWGTASAGYKGTAYAGYKGTASAGIEGTASAGIEGTASAGYKGTASAGYKGTASAGYKGTASAGIEGTASAGIEGTASAGDKGEIRIRYLDNKAGRYRTVIGYIGEDGLEPNTPYKLDDNHKFVKA